MAYPNRNNRSQDGEKAKFEVLKQKLIHKIDKGTFILAVRRITGKTTQGRVAEYVEVKNWVKRETLDGISHTPGMGYMIPMDNAAEIAQAIALAITTPYDAEAEVEKVSE